MGASGRDRSGREARARGRDRSMADGFFFCGNEVSPWAGLYILRRDNDATQHSSEKNTLKAISHVVEMNLRD